ncbi:cytochrome b5-like heme/steroid binding domain-containing protein, partial [Pavlovales sp. CCMP2436]
MTEQPSRRVGTAELRAHTSRASLWLVLNGHVYDVSSFQFDHPGGKRVLLEHAGTDATQPFVSLHSPK